MHKSFLLISILSSLAFSFAAQAQSQSITPSATASDDASITQSNSTSSTTQDQDVTNSSTNTVSGDQINNTYINQPASDDNASIRPRGGRDPLRSASRDRDRDGDRSRGRDAYDRDLLRAADPLQRQDLVNNKIEREDNQIEAQQDAIRADDLMRSTLQGAYNAQSVNNRAPDTGRIPRPTTGPAAAVQFAPQPAPAPIVVVPPVMDRGRSSD